MVSLFVGTPLYNGQLSHMYLRGALDAQKQHADIQFSVAVGTYLAINRQTLTDRFLATDATHFLMVDGDIGWTWSAVEKLLSADVGMVSGVYLQRNGESVIPAEPIGDAGIQRGALIECYCVPAGFLLLTRDTLLRMKEAYPSGPLWTFGYGASGYVGEDVHFCQLLRGIGGHVWLHPEAIVDHVGEVVFKLPKDGAAVARFKT